MILGFVIGGIGSRIAMLVLRLTSSPNLHGVQTDDDFTIGIISSASLFLLFLCLFVGAIGGIVHAVTATWIPSRVAPLVNALLTGSIGAAQILNPHGLDFELLDPLGLAVGMFVVIPFAYGALLPVLARRLATWGQVAPGWRFKASFAPVVMLLPTAFWRPNYWCWRGLRRSCAASPSANMAIADCCVGRAIADSGGQSCQRQRDDQGCTRDPVTVAGVSHAHATVFAASGGVRVFVWPSSS